VGKAIITKESLQIRNLLKEVFSKKKFITKKAISYLAILVLILVRLSQNHSRFFEVLSVHISQTTDDCRYPKSPTFRFLRTKCNFTRKLAFITKSLDLWEMSEALYSFYVQDLQHSLLAKVS